MKNFFSYNMKAANHFLNKAEFENILVVHNAIKMAGQNIIWIVIPKILCSFKRSRL